MDLADDDPDQQVSGRQELSLLQKKELCELKDRNKGLTQVQLAKIAKKKFGLEPSLSQIGRMLQKRKDIFTLSGKRLETGKRVKGAKFPDLEKAVDAWFTEVRRRTDLL